MSAPDTSALTGANTPTVTPLGVPQAQPTTPDYTQQSIPTLPNPPTSSSGSVPTAPQAAGQPSVWKNLVMGAIAGLAGSAGAKHFGAGMAGGAEGYLAQKQQQVANSQAQQELAQHQQQLQFESLAAADSHVKALNQVRADNQAYAKGNTEIAQLNAEHQVYLSENGIDPDITIDDSHDAGVGALSTLADANGGKIPAVFVSPTPSDDGTHGKIAIYAAPTQQKLQQNSTAYLNMVNKDRAIRGLPGMDPLLWRTMKWQDKSKMALAAMNGTTSTPEYSLNKSDNQNYLPAVLNTKKQQLANYEDHQDANGKPDADPRTVAILQKGIDYLQNQWADSNKMEADQATQIAAATAKGTQQAETSPSAIQGAANKASAVAGAEAQAREKYDDKPAYAVQTDTNGTQHTILTTHGQALATPGLTAIRPATQADINKDQHDIKVLNDIQVKSDNVKNAAIAMDQNSWGQAAVAAKYLADNPNTPVNTLLKSAALKNATPQTQAYVIAVQSLRESSMGLQKVLTGSARSNETQLQALQNTLPGIEPNSGIVNQKLQAFDQNLGMLSQGLPENTGVKVQVRHAGQAPQVGAVKTFPNGNKGTWDGQGWVKQ